MKIALLVVLLVPLAHGSAGAQTPPGDAQAGKVFWTGPHECRMCHGDVGEGGFGPDLAARGLTVAQFKRAVRKPWGIMPAFTEAQVSDQDLENAAAYLRTLPSASEPKTWKFPIPESPSPGQALFYSIGCVQCHQPAFAGPRAQLGQVGADFDYFKKLVYTHTTAMPEHQKLIGIPQGLLRMGNFNPLRVPEPTLQEIFKYVRDEMGFRPAIRGRVAPGVTSEKGVTYTIEIENAGLAGKGLAAEDITVSLDVPAGAMIATTSGAGYQGVARNPQTSGEAISWTLRRLGPAERQTYAITFAQAVENLRGAVRWLKPSRDGAPDIAPIGQSQRGRGPGPQ